MSVTMLVDAIGVDPTSSSSLQYGPVQDLCHS